MLFVLDFSSAIPIYMQIRNGIVMGIADGRLSPGEKLPTIRALAEQTGVNAMTVNKAYALLKQEGYILIDRRAGAVVNPAHAENGKISEQMTSWLRLAAAEAKLNGIPVTQLVTVLEQCYEEEGKR